MLISVVGPFLITKIMIKFLKFDNIILSKICSRMIMAITFSRPNDIGSPTHYLVLEKSCSHSHPCFRI